MMDSRISESPPKEILCQGDHGGCAACCGVFNDKDRKDFNKWKRKIELRTQKVDEANFNIDKLLLLRNNFIKTNATEILYTNIKVCPFSGFIAPDRLGCLIHPSRHPENSDLRDISVHNQKICSGHFCASHDWLRPIEYEMIKTAHGVFYGTLISQPGLVKQLRACIEEQLGRKISTNDCTNHGDTFKFFWQKIAHWPFRDLNPNRFGGFVFIGDDASAKTLPHCKTLFPQQQNRLWVSALQELESALPDPTTAQQAMQYLRKVVGELAEDLG